MTNDRLNFQPKYRKIVEALLYIAGKRVGTDHYAASKYIYLADRKHFNTYGRPITFDVLGAMPWGPVALKSYELLKQEAPAMRAAQIAELPFETARIDKCIYLGAPKREVDFDAFSESDIEVLDDILTEYGALTMPELHAVTKEHAAYQKSWNNRPQGARLALISYEDVLDSVAEKEALIDDLAPISHRV